MKAVKRLLEVSLLFHYQFQRIDFIAIITSIKPLGDQKLTQKYTTMRLLDENDQDD